VERCDFSTGGGYLRRGIFGAAVMTASLDYHLTTHLSSKHLPVRMATVGRGDEWLNYHYSSEL
jgi:hypothetical protein